MDIASIRAELLGIGIDLESCNLEAGTPIQVLMLKVKLHMALMNIEGLQRKVMCKDFENRGLQKELAEKREELQRLTEGVAGGVKVEMEEQPEVEVPHHSGNGTGDFPMDPGTFEGSLNQLR